MSSSSIFRELHLLHQNAHGLREQLTRLPFQLKAQRARVAKQEADLHAAQEAIKHLKVKIRDLESTLKTKQQALKKYRQQEENASSTRELEAFKTEIAHAEAESQALEDQILASMMETEERTAALPGLEKLLVQVKEECAKFETSAKERQGVLAEGLKKVELQLVEAEKNIPTEVRSLYDRIVRAKGADALAPARGKACGGCSIELTAQNYTNLLTGAFHICKSCERIVYPVE